MSGACPLVRVGSALVIFYLIYTNKILGCLSLLKTFQPYEPLIYPYIVLYFALIDTIFQMRTNLCLQTFILTGSMVGQWCLVCNPSNFTSSCNKSETSNFTPGSDIFDKYNSCATKWRKMSVSVLDSLVAYSTISKMWCADGVDDLPLMYSGISLRIFPI